MKIELTLSPHKTGAQGFGSAKQFLDIFFKYDVATMTGYGLRIARVPEISDPIFKDYAAKSCTFTLMEYKNGVATPISDAIVSTAFLPGCSITIQMENNVLTADVTTTTQQDSAYPNEMPHEVHLTHTFEEVNLYSGFGFQHTGTAGAGKSGNRTTIHSLKTTYGAEIISEEPVTDDNPDASQDSVQTGDTAPFNIAKYFILIMLSGGISILIFKRRKNITRV